MVDAIEAIEPASQGRISFEDTPLPFPEEADDSALIEALGPVPYTLLSEGVSGTISVFKRAIAAGRITAEALGNSRCHNL